MNKPKIPIFFTIDDKYVYYVSTAIVSLMENASKEYDYKIIILYQDVDDKDLKYITSLADGKDNFEIELIYMEKGLESITDREENKLRCDYFTLTIYFRLFIPEMFPEFDKGIYIDSDIVVPGDISEMYKLDLGNNIIGACADHSIEHIPELAKYTAEAIGAEKGKYVNSGVLLMNLKIMREKEFSKNFLELLNTYHFDSIAPDQDYLNAMCKGKILFLDECWNAMPNDSKKALENPKIIHYNLFKKPWCYDNVKYEEYFWEYAKKTKYYNDILKAKKDYSDNQKQADSECLGVLINKGDEIPGQDVTFKKVFDEQDNFATMIDKEKEIGNPRNEVIANIKKAVENKEFNSKVEVNDPKLSIEEKEQIVKKYMKNRKKLKYKFNSTIAKTITSVATHHQKRTTKIKGLENLKKVKGGAIITSNHFNPTDSIAIRKLMKKSGRGRLYTIGQESNMAMRGLVGYLMKYMDIIPISSLASYMKKDFPDIIQEKLEKGNCILIYPEQEMWFNYKKPRPPKPGAYYYAAKFNVPIISCFVEIVEKGEKLEYILHVLPPIYPDEKKTVKENKKQMMEKDFEQKKRAYEKAYGKELNYEFEEEDIAGWIDE